MNTCNAVFEKDGSLYLDTAMNQSGFAKSRYTERLAEKGMLAELTDGSWKFTPWGFTGAYIQASDENETNIVMKHMNEKVFVTGKAFAGKTLKAYFDDTESKAAYSYAAGLVCSVMEAAAERSVKLPANGAGGIFIADDFTKLIFLPETVFDNAVTPLRDENYLEEENAYICRSIKGPAALRYIQSVIAYRALTGEFPFAQKDRSIHHEDYIDHNFVRLEDKLYGVDESLAFFIDNSLLRQAKTERHKKAPLADKRSLNEKITQNILEGATKAKNELQEKRILRAGVEFPLELLYKELGLNSDGNLNADGSLNPPERKLSVSIEKFSSSVQTRYEKKAKKLAVKRWFRHNSTPVTVITCVVAVMLFLFFTSVDNEQNTITTKGLTSFETVELFYSSLNSLNIPAAQECVKGKRANGMVDSAANFYVTTKQREAYIADEKFVPTAYWLNYNNENKYLIFGLSQITADGKPLSLYREGIQKKTKPDSLAIEDGKLLADKDTKTITAEYKLSYVTGVEELTIVEEKDILTLTYKKNRWIITDIDQTQNEKIINFTEFISDYNNAKTETGDVYKTAEILKGKYDFISTDFELKEAEDAISREVSAMEKALGF